jgi:HlyD family secretion protein
MSLFTHRKVPPHPVNQPKPAGSRRPRRAGRIFIVTTPFLLFAGTTTWWSASSPHVPRPDLLTHPVHYERLQVAYTEHGVVTAAASSDVMCRVKARTHGSTVATTIKWVIDDGTPVRNGEVVARLDDSALQEDLKNEHIAVIKARSDWLQADANCEIVQTQNQADIQTASVTLELAEVDYKKYVLGDYNQAHMDVEGRRAQAEGDLSLSRGRVGWAERMLRKGFATQNQVHSEQGQLQNFEVVLDRVNEEKRVLERFTRKRTQTELAANLAEARRAVGRVKSQTVAKQVQADGDRLAKLQIYRRELQRYGDLEDQLACCTLRSPRDGIVVYCSSEQARSGSGAQQGIVAQGEPVREGQRLIEIPDLTRMMVETKVHESALFHIHAEERRHTGFKDAVRAGLFTPAAVFPRLALDAAFCDTHDYFRDLDERVLGRGDPAVIQIHAFPDQVWHGHVKLIGSVASYVDWRLTATKLYPTLVTVDEAPLHLKPGMTADVTIMAERPLEHVLTVPVEALVGSVKHGERSQCFVLTDDGPQARAIVLGATNDAQAEIKNGIHEGDEVVLNPETLAERSKAISMP